MKMTKMTTLSLYLSLTLDHDLVRHDYSIDSVVGVFRGNSCNVNGANISDGSCLGKAACSEIQQLDPVITVGANSWYVHQL